MVPVRVLAGVTQMERGGDPMRVVDKRRPPRIERLFESICADFAEVSVQYWTILKIIINPASNHWGIFREAFCCVISKNFGKRWRNMDNFFAKAMAILTFCSLAPDMRRFCRMAWGLINMALHDQDPMKDSRLVRSPEK